MTMILDLARFARGRGASDLHLVASLPPAVRINGEIHMVKSEPLTRDELREAILALASPEQKEHLDREKELCFSLFDDEAGRMRVTVYYHAGSPELSVRLCARELPDAATLGLPLALLEASRRSNGLILITGPTGVGKTTTLNFIVDMLNRERRCKIITIEDPVEFLHRSHRAIVVQQEVYTDTLSFPRALTHVLRQNPDVIVIGEMRELETISTALIAAETGHLVIATLHTPNVMQTMERIVSVFPPDHQKQIILQLANTLQCIISQDLLPKADGSGRVLAYELLLCNQAVKNMIRENSVHMIEHAIMSGRREGMITMDLSLADLYRKAIITFDVAASHARDPKTLTRGN